MRKQLMLIAAPLCVVAIAATVASAAPSSSDASRGPKLDKLHAVRPIAAKSSVLVPTGLTPGEVGKEARVSRAASTHPHKDKALSRRLRRLRAQRRKVVLGAAVAWSEAVAKAHEADAQAWGVAATAAAQAQAWAGAVAAGQAEAAAAQRVSSPVYSNSSPGGFLACVRNRESGGNYGVYNQGGSGAAGAYQFLPGTWNSVAASVGRSDLVGVSPAQASPADQDAMAQALYTQQGSAPWGGSCG